jgi:hypothetical protein
LTTPKFVTVATALLLLVHVPPVVGDNVVVPLTQITLGPVMFPTGQELIITARVGNDIHPPILVKVKVADPTDNPVTIPSLLTLAILVLLLDQVPPVVGDNLVVPFMQIEFAPVILTVGAALTVTAEVGNEAHPPALVKIKVADPGDIPLTTPELLTLAITELLLDHVPPVVGDSTVVELIQITLGPVTFTAAPALTVIVL